MTTTEDKPVDREAWRRLLDARGDGPPELTDARIRAQARQALSPRTGRWWLPASLAASMLLAIVLVQQQYERPRAPAVVSESDYATPPAESPAAAALERAAPREGAERKEDLRNFTPAPAPPAPEAKREEEAGEIVVSGSRQRQADSESSTPVTQVTSEDVSGRTVANSGALMKSGEAGRSPEEWYAEIEKLRAAGKKREAGRQLKKLEEAHPGWLEKNHPTDR